jgi:hypothetical protein
MKSKWVSIWMLSAAITACRSDIPVGVAPRANEPKSVSASSANVTSLHYFTAVATGKGQNGNLQVVLLGTDKLLYLVYQVNSSGNWYWYGALPNPSGVQFKDVAVGIANNNNLQVVALGASDGRQYLTWQSASDGGWHWYGQLPNVAGFYNQTVGTNGSNMEAIGNFGGLGSTLSDAYVDKSGTWHNYGLLPIAPERGAIFTDPQTLASGCQGSCSTGQLHVFFLTTAFPPGVNDVWKPSGGTWQTSFLLPDDNVTFYHIATMIDWLSRIWVIGVDQSGKPYAIYNQGSWTWLGALPNQGVSFYPLATGMASNQWLWVISVPGVNSMYRDNGGWHFHGALPNPLGKTFTQAATGVGNSSHLQLIAIATDGLPYLIYEANGNWNWYGQLPTP